MTTQGEEEAIISNYAPMNGRFLDIGAYDGKTFSNTRALAESGFWSGVLVEPSAWAFHELSKLYLNHTGMMLIQAFIEPGPKSAPPLKLFHYALSDLLTTMDEDHKKKWSHDARFREAWAPSITVDQLVHHVCPPVDFISIDTEGTSVEIFLQLAVFLDFLETTLICVEHYGRLSEIGEAADSFHEVWHDGNNVILSR